MDSKEIKAFQKGIEVALNCVEQARSESITDMRQVRHWIEAEAKKQSLAPAKEVCEGLNVGYPCFCAVCQKERGKPIEEV